jgi:hypothetical protein
MQVSAEIRWFWHDASPPSLEDWFCKADGHYCSAGGGGTRVDEYLRDASQVELGLKRRGSKKGVEVKGLVAVTWGGLAVGPFAGPVELWAKWTSEPLELNSASTVTTTKRRWRLYWSRADRRGSETDCWPATQFGSVIFQKIRDADRPERVRRIVSRQPRLFEPPLEHCPRPRCARAGLDGTPPAGRALTLPGATFLQVEGDKIRSEHVYHDRQTIAEQLGLKATKD